MEGLREMNKKTTIYRHCLPESSSLLITVFFKHTHTHPSLKFPVVEEERAELQGDFEFICKVLRTCVLVEGLLYLQQLS